MNDSQMSYLEVVREVLAHAQAGSRNVEVVPGQKQAGRAEVDVAFAAEDILRPVGGKGSQAARGKRDKH